MFIEPHISGERRGWIEVICGSMFSGKTEDKTKSKLNSGENDGVPPLQKRARSFAVRPTTND